ncbi:hypothetical protein R3W88_015137 [Solanum pinnatisectum]|uniref:No apical meristem-associated C-terminal domain-containing protein n=1 Tax=Solanum pinnatisectum TaxID=50273 RepID=A0AAV9KTN0_9SOLN|nr:hypothetical protein R3W88_015137 [Solanum pinnatisectum]
MQQLNKAEFMGVDGRVQQLRRELIEKQSNMRIVPISQSMMDEEKLLRKELEKWSLIDEKIYKQKSRI